MNCICMCSYSFNTRLDAGDGAKTTTLSYAITQTATCQLNPLVHCGSCVDVASERHSKLQAATGPDSLCLQELLAERSLEPRKHPPSSYS